MFSALVFLWSAASCTVGDSYHLKSSFVAGDNRSGNSAEIDERNNLRAINPDGSDVVHGSQEMSSLTPTLRWTDFRKFEYGWNRKEVKITDVHYQLVVFKVKYLSDYRARSPGGFSWENERMAYLDLLPNSDQMVANVREIKSTSHTLTEPLEPNSTYVWSVRAFYREDDDARISSWLVLDDRYSNYYLYSFNTPEKP